MKIIRWIAGTAAVLAVAALASCGGSAPASAAGTITTSAATGTVTIAGMDLHDGMILQDGSTFYMYGTRYGCGFNWGHTNFWCGYGVSSAPSLAGPWTTPRLLFSASARIEANWTKDDGMTWSAMCGAAGQGCFNPRMIHTPNGRWLLWFNAPGDKSRAANPYWNMTCSGPAGPCGSPHKPAMYAACKAGGDFTVAFWGTQGWIACSGHEHELMTEPLAAGMTDGANAQYPVPGTDGESPGLFRTASGYEMTMADPGCGYCSGTKVAAANSPVASGLAYATAPSMSGPWTYQGQIGPACVGEPRSSFSDSGAIWEWTDRWNGTGQETDAAVALTPLSAATCAS